MREKKEREKKEREKEKILLQILLHALIRTICSRNGNEKGLGLKVSFPWSKESRRMSLLKVSREQAF